MADDDGPNHESLEALLAWLDPDRDKAWEKYQAIWERLIKIFTWRRRKNVEDLAGEVVNRVTRNVPKVVNVVAYNLLLELPRQEARFSEFQEESDLGGITETVDSEAVDVYELRLRCLDECLAQLKEKDREIILAYYQFDQKTKLADRQQLAEELGLSKSALWTRVSRVRSLLGKCVRARLDEEGQTH
jgi:DNA-directed RNA polymerase specialized sigma24 family protein